MPDGLMDARVGFLVRRLHQAHIATFTSEFEELKLTPIQWGVMVVVAAGDGLPIADIAARCGADRVTVGDVVRRLEDRGFIRQAQGLEDKRQRLAFITGYGREIVESQRERVDKVQAKLLKALTEAEAREFVRLARKILSD
ncbi:MAG: MarR family transcriptional regulator [Zavarzinia sp.]|nr:MarR family transcriptional regulator [Zavarzinia sp.]